MLSAAVGETHKLKVRHRQIYEIEVTIESIKQTSLVFYQDPVYVQRRSTFDEASAFCL